MAPSVVWPGGLFACDGDTPASDFYVILGNPLDPPILSCAWTLSGIRTRPARASGRLS